MHINMNDIGSLQIAVEATDHYQDVCIYIYESQWKDFLFFDTILVRITAPSLGLARIVLQCVAVCCSVLQCVAVCCSVLQCVQHTAQSLRDSFEMTTLPADKIGDWTKLEILV